MLLQFGVVVTCFTGLQWWKMEPRDDLVSQRAYCLTEPGRQHLVYLPRDGDWAIALRREATEKRPAKIWNRKGPLGETPKRIADASPLSDQDYTSAALHSKARSSYGYYEVKARPMNSGGSSSFWFQQDETPGWATEIDVFEIGGNAKGFERKYHMNLHVFGTPKEKKHWSVGGIWEAPWRLAGDYHVYRLDWGKEELKFYVDGVLVRSVENTHWRQPLYLIFDSETMPKWFGMPDDKDLPSTFSIEYVRAWKRKDAAK